jgi:dTMP kinase
MLARWLRTQGLKVVVTREPGGPFIAEKIRRLLLDVRHRKMSPLAELMLLEASRAQHVDEVVAPALRQGAVVLCDRFADSSAAYQGYGRGLDLGTVDSLNRIASRGAWPDLTLLLDVPVEQGLRRASGRGRALDRMESQEKRFHRRVRQGYRRLASSEPWRIKLLDGTQPPDVVQAAVRQLVVSKLAESNSIRKPGIHEKVRSDRTEKPMPLK